MKKTSKNECSTCPALCCEGLTIDITKPRTKDDVEILMWKLQYEDIGVYILNKRWHLFFSSRCGYLNGDDLCTVYEKRSDICRKHNPPQCERYLDWYDEFFSTPEELRKYFERERRRVKRRRNSGNNSK